MRWIPVLVAACLLSVAPAATAATAASADLGAVAGSDACSGLSVAGSFFTGTCTSGDCTTTYAAGKPVFHRCDP